MADRHGGPAVGKRHLVVIRMIGDRSAPVRNPPSARTGDPALSRRPRDGIGSTRASTPPVDGRSGSAMASRATDRQVLHGLGNPEAPPCLLARW